MRRPILVILVAVASLWACSPFEATDPACDEAVDVASTIPAALAARGVKAAVGSGDTWFLPPATGRWSQDVRWNDGQFFLKLGVWSLSSEPPVITVRKVGAKVTGSAASSPTSEGLPGPLPTTLRFPSTGCWEVVGQGATGTARARIRVDESARGRDGAGTSTP
jgi:hypothetical protein